VIQCIFMLTHNDKTVDNALDVYEKTRGTSLAYLGFKDVGSDPDQLAAITSRAHDDGIEVMLEIVEPTAEGERSSLALARDLGVDWVAGGSRPELGLEELKGTAIKYAPFVGQQTGSPSVLTGSIQEIADQSARLTALDGIDGVNVGAYRHVSEDPVKLVENVVAASTGLVIASGSVASREQVQLLAAAGAWAFTIGGAIFDNKLPAAADVRSQLAAALSFAS
jgi:hypothetical protein